MVKLVQGQGKGETDRSCRESLCGQIAKVRGFHAIAASGFGFVKSAVSTDEQRLNYFGPGGVRDPGAYSGSDGS